MAWVVDGGVIYWDKYGKRIGSFGGGGGSGFVEEMMSLVLDVLLILYIGEDPTANGAQERPGM